MCLGRRENHDQAAVNTVLMPVTNPDIKKAKLTATPISRPPIK